MKCALRHFEPWLVLSHSVSMHTIRHAKCMRKITCEVFLSTLPRGSAASPWSAASTNYAPLPCKIPSVCQHLARTINTCLAESTFVLTLVCVVLSSVGSRLVRATHGLPFSGTGVPWVSCLDPPVCLRIQDDPEAKSQPVVVSVGVLR